MNLNLQLSLNNDLKIASSILLGDIAVMKLPFFKNKQNVVEQEVKLDKLPEHIAIIMDGNGRWAKQRGLPRIAGHKEGMDAVQKTVQMAVKYKIKILTLYAFSTENWKRPKTEVDYLMKLPKEFLHIYLPDLIRNNVKVSIIGEIDELPEYTKEAIYHAIEKTKNNDGLQLNFAFNYGSRYEILRAIKQIVKEAENGELDIDSLTEENFSNYLYTNNIQDPDLLIRTSGEQRLSNFLLWQSAYSEFWFTDVLWPDFNEEVFKQALCDYQLRKRRYGGI